MTNNTAITICRQFCSGGRIIGENVAKRLNYAFYDKKLVTLAAQRSGYAEEVFSKMDEVATNSLLYSLVMGIKKPAGGLAANNNVLTNDKLFNIQSDIIKEAAEKQSCVFVGRCADFVLQEHERLIKVFIRADMDYRIEQYEKTRELPQNHTAEYILHKMDKKRSSYYEFYSGKDWLNMENYDIVINTAKTDIDTAVDIIVNYVNSSF